MSALPSRPAASLEQALGYAAVLAVTLGLATAAARSVGLGPTFLGVVAILTIAGLGLAVIASPAAHRLGPADYVTSLRIGLTALVAALALHPAGQGTAWMAVGTALLALALDGVDGWLARRTGTTSAHGARLDMETDAAMILVLCLACWHHGKAGAWILAGGLARYAFVAAARVWPALGAPLPPSRRRQGVCVVQTASLVACLSPALEPRHSAPLAAAALALVIWSFAIDVRWLLRRMSHHR